MPGFSPEKSIINLRETPPQQPTKQAKKYEDLTWKTSTSLAEVKKITLESLSRIYTIDDEILKQITGFMDEISPSFYNEMKIDSKNSDATGADTDYDEQADINWPEKMVKKIEEKFNLQNRLE